MESHPQNPEFQNNPENFWPCKGSDKCPDKGHFMHTLHSTLDKQRICVYTQLKSSKKQIK